MKKFLALVMSILIVLSLSGCDVILILIDQLMPTETTTVTKDIETTKSTKSTTSSKTQTSTDKEYNPNYSNYRYYDICQAGYYEWYVMDSIGDKKILVIPVTISGYTTSCTNRTLTDLYTGFFGKAEDTMWESLSSYYYKSSYGKLNITGRVLPWTQAYSTKSLRDSFDPVIENTDAYLKANNVDPKDFDSDNDGFIDCVYYIYSSPYYDDYSHHSNIPDYFWAYSSCADLEADIDSPKVNNYCMASVDFLYSDEGEIDAHTYIHEFGHLLGLDDYYNASSDYEYYTGDAVGSSIMMSNNILDHDAFSKCALGWITPTIITSSMSLELSSIEDSAEAIIISDSDDSSLFREYFILEYYTPTGLNEADTLASYDGLPQGVNGCGVRIYKVDARVGYYDSSNQLVVLDSLSDFDESLGCLAYVAHSNTAEYSLYTDDYGNINNKKEAMKPLLELIDKSGVSHLEYDYVQTIDSFFNAGDSIDLSTIKLNSGKALNYIISFSNEKDNKITVTITEK